ncbi:Pentatricopeptide repeat-containing protein [Apostasia shenzhenica]|uniref:Pentatricopeptide repeat-containing protein n=1 Tax=Apostasia shenzhenica TaxID=1088818 RepID=A0A2I0AYE1_9ASPA|nr:Pentatricopeptide repeat-containing protein [Apostasia shenzhenica]
MAAWIASPLAAVSPTAVSSLNFLITGLRLLRRCGCLWRHQTTFSDAGQVSLSDAAEGDVKSSTSGEELLVRLSRCFRVEKSPMKKAVGWFCGGVDPLRLLREAKNPDVYCYTNAMDALMRDGRCREAENVFNEMITSGIAPDSIFCSFLVKLYALGLKDFASAYHIFRVMVERGFKPDVIDYTTLIAGLCHAGKVDDAFSVLILMLKGSCMPNARTFNPILQAYCAEGKVDSAKELLLLMRSWGCPPDIVNYNVLIHGLCQNGEFEEVESILSESSENGWEPDTVSYNTYISGLSKMGRTDEALKQLEIMLEKGLPPSEVTLNILLGLFCRDLKATEIIFLLRKSFELRLGVDAATFNTVIKMLCDIGEYPSVLKLLSEMFKKGIRPDTQTFNIVILSLCKGGKLSKAKWIFRSKGFTPDIWTYNILSHELCLVREFDEFHQLLAQMVSTELSPNAITYNIIVDGLCLGGKFSMAIGLVRSLECGFKSDHVAHLAFGLINGGRVEDLMRLLEEMMNQGVLVDARIFESIIKAFCKKGCCNSLEVHKICLVLDKLLGRKG